MGVITGIVINLNGGEGVVSNIGVPGLILLILLAMIIGGIFFLYRVFKK
jgi:hypothetical protein